MELSTGLLDRLVWRMDLIAAWLFLAFGFVGIVLSYLFPKTFIAVAVAVLLAMIGLFALTGRHSSHFKPRCLSCGGSRLDILSMGFWDDFENATGGRFTWAVCKDCGTRRVEYEPRKPYIPTEEAWQSYFAPIEKENEKRKRETEKWPFHSEESAPGI